MVVEVIYQRDDTMQVVSSQEEEQEGRVSENIHRVMYDMDRDTSHTTRQHGDDTRQSIQSTSILNCTGETEDEDDGDIEEPGSFLFDEEDFYSPINQSLDQSFNNEEHIAFVDSTPASPTAAQQKALFCVNDRWLDTSLQDVTESFVSFCSSKAEEPCGFPDFTTASESCSRQLQQEVELDLMHLLGCDAPVSSSKGTLSDVTWFSPLLIKASSSPNNTNGLAEAASRASRPVGRRNPRQRAERIRQMRNQVLGEAQPARIVSPTRSMDDHTLNSIIGRGIDPVESQGEDGYDSDPGLVLPAETLRDTSLLDDEEENEEEYHFYDGHRARLAEEYRMRMQHRGPRDEHDREVYEGVQVAMNSTWTLTWHAKGSSPMCIHFWIERGTMLNQGSVVVEPKFMWRQVYQPSLGTSRTLSESSRKPMDVRVLNACRIVEAGPQLDRSKYPMARSACSFFLKTCRDEVFLFEASSPEEKEQIVRQWKLVVARLASLAVVEDMGSMAKEFFTPAVNSQMLITNDRL